MKAQPREGEDWKKEVRNYFPRAVYFGRTQTTEFFVNDIYADDDIGFGGDNTMEETGTTSDNPFKVGFIILFINLEFFIWF